MNYLFPAPSLDPFGSSYSKKSFLRFGFFISSASNRSYTSKEEAGTLLVDLLCEKSGLSKSIIKKLMIFGAVIQSFKTTKRRIRKAKTLVRANDIIECYFDPRVNLDETYEFPIIYFTKHYGIYIKPAGATTLGTNFGDKTSVFRYVEKLKKFAFPVNRVDDDNAGLVIVAYDSKTQNLLQSMLKTEITKKYQTIVKGELIGSGSLTDKINNKFTQTDYNCIKTQDNETYIELKLASERKNQIKFHFSKKGHPVIEDKIVSYGLSFKDPHSDELVNVSIDDDQKLF